MSLSIYLMGIILPNPHDQYEETKKLFGPSHEVIAVIDPKKKKEGNKNKDPEIPPDTVLELLFQLGDKLVAKEGKKKMIKNLVSLPQIKEDLKEYIQIGIPIDHAIRLLQRGITSKEALEKMHKQHHSLSDIIGMGEQKEKKSHYFID